MTGESAATGARSSPPVSGDGAPQTAAQPAASGAGPAANGPGRPARTRRRKWARGLGRIFSALAILAMLAAAGLILLTSRPLDAPEWLRARIEDRIAEALPGARVQFGAIQLRMGEGWRPGVRLSDVSVLTANGAPLAELARLDASFDRTAALRRELRPEAVSMSGGFLTVRRQVTGGFDMAFAAPGPQGPPQEETGPVPALPDPGLEPPRPASLIEALDAVFADPRLSELTQVTANGLTVRYEDLHAGRVWTADGGRVRLTQGREDISLSADVALLGGGASVTTLAVTYESPKGSPAATLGVTVDAMPAADIASQVPSAAWLGVLDAPISGAMRGGLAEDGSLQPLNAVLTIGKGAVRPNAQASPVPFDGARTYFTVDPASNSIRFDALSVQSGWLSGEAEGQAWLHPGPDGWPERLTAQIVFDGLNAAPAGFYERPVALSRASADLQVRLDPFEVTIGEAMLEDASGRINARGRITAGDEGWRAGFDARIPEAGKDRLMQLWPLRQKPGTRDWVERNILGGTMHDLRFALRAGQGQKPQFMMATSFEGAELRFLPQMPPLQEASGYLTLGGHQFSVVADHGQVTAPIGGLLDVAGSSFTIPDTREKPAPAEVALRISGPVPAALSVLDRPPLEALSKAGRSPDMATGQMQVTARIGFPLKRGMTPDEVTYDAAGTVTGLVSEGAVPGRTIAAPRMELQLDPGALQLSGRGTIDGVPFDATWRQPRGPGADGASSLQGGVELSQRFLDTFGITLPQGMATGRGWGDIALDLAPGAAPRFELATDTRGLRLSVPALGWSKGPDRAGSLRLAGTLGAAPRINSLALEAPGLTLTGAVSTRPGGGLDEARFSRVRAGSWLDAPVRLVGSGAGRPPSVVIDGGTADLRALPARGGSGGESGPLEVALSRLQVNGRIALTDFRGSFAGGQGLDGTFEGKVNGGAAITGRALPRDGRLALRIQSRDAGGVVRAAGLSDKLRGGQMDMTLTPRGAPGNYDGRLQAREVRVRDVPAMAALLSAISIVGLFEQMGGEGLLFQETEADFRLSPDSVTVLRASAAGPSIGLSLDGTVALGTGLLDMQGVISPLYLLNRVGSVLTRKGEGLIGFNFTLTGPASEPRVSVNPLSVLTPGMFREIFRRAPPQ